MVNIRDIIGPPRWEEEVADLVSNFGRAASHISLGTRDLSNALALRIVASWDVQNTGTAYGVAGMKMTIIETKGAPLFNDVEWYQHAPWVGGGGVAIDLQKAETGFATAPFGDYTAGLQPGVTRALNIGAEFSGPLLNPTMADFWYNRHPQPTFKVVVEVVDLDPASATFVRSLASHTFPTAYNVKAQKALAALLVAVGDPTIAAYIV